MTRGEPASTPFNADRSALCRVLDAYHVLAARALRAVSTPEFTGHGSVSPTRHGDAFRDGRVTAAGSLDDQFAVASAFLDAFEVTGVARYLDSARALVTHAVARFRAPDGGFFDTPDEDRPGGNALAAIVLDRLHELTNEAVYRTLARDTLAALPRSAQPLGPRVATYAYAADVHVNGALHVVITGKAADPRTRMLWRGALRAFRPGKVVAAYDPTSSTWRRPGAGAPCCDRRPGGAARVRVRGTVCSCRRPTPSDSRARETPGARP